MVIYLIYAVLILIAVRLNTIALTSKKQGFSLWLIYGLPTLVMVIFSWLVSASNFCGDFNKSYYPAGRLIIENSSSLYEWGRGLGFVNIPIVAVLFTPISFLPKLAAQIIITILGLIAIWISVKLLFELTNASTWQKLAIGGMFLINGPLYYSLKQGNSTHFALLLLILALFGLRDKREIWVGIVLAIAAIIKIPLLLFGIYFALRQRWRIVIGFAATILVILGLSLLLFGVNLHIIWLEKCILSFGNKIIAAFNVQSVDGFLARLLNDVEINNWQPIEIERTFKALRYLLTSILVGSTLYICWRSKSSRTLESEYLEFSIVLCLAMLISSISWTHYYLYLLLPFSLYICNKLGIPQGKIWWRSLLFSGILVSLPVIIIKTSNPTSKFLITKLFVSHYFFGGVLLLSILLTARWHANKNSTIVT